MGSVIRLAAAPDSGRPLSLLDAGFLYLDRPRAPLQIGAIVRVDGVLDEDDVVVRLEERVRLLPRFAQFPRSVPLSAGHPTWEDAPDFRPRDHVFPWAVSAEEGDPMDCRRLCDLLAEPLPAGRPLWDLHLFASASARTTALLFRAHHCMVDGVGGLACLDRLLDVAPAAAAVRNSAPRAEATGSWDRFKDALWLEARRRRDVAAFAAHCLRSPAAAGEALGLGWRGVAAAREWLRQGVPEQRWNAPLTARRRLGTTTLSLDRIREIRSARGCRFNDVVLCVIGGGLARYLDRTGADTSVPLQALVPVNRRSPEDGGDSMANRLAAMRAPIPVDRTSEAERLARIQRETGRLMWSRAWRDSEAWLAVLDALPPSVVAPLARSARLGRFANLVVTNVAGPAEKRSFCGRPVHEIRPIVPLYHGLGLGVAAASYAGELSLTLHADAEHVPDLDRLVSDVAEAAAALAHETSAGRSALPPQPASSKDSRNLR